MMVGFRLQNVRARGGICADASDDKVIHVKAICEAYSKKLKYNSSIYKTNR